ncbi:MAG TPA: hypothetical protein VJ577_08270 [Burkholderiaceae bacterium]|nr:hypothetical protein [Burkholderiaceae bacterium]
MRWKLVKIAGKPAMQARKVALNHLLPDGDVEACMNGLLPALSCCYHA